VKRGNGYVHVAVDDCFRVGDVAAYPDERTETWARFLEEAAGFFASWVRTERVMTDRAKAYVEGEPFRAALLRRRATHAGPGRRFGLDES
jgi:hypothetical protein